MRCLVVVFALLLATATAHAQSADPIRVTVQCEQIGRTKACPAFLLGIIDANKVLLQVPRSAADVVVYATSTEFALIDRLHLRFVGTIAGAPSSIELDAELDTRGTDDEQRAVLEPVFLRGIALFVAARHPTAVTVALTAPASVAAVKPKTSPWGIALNMGGGGSYTNNYRSAQGEVALVARYITPRFRALTLNVVQGALNRQPPLTLEDGTVVSLDTQQWAVRVGAEAIYLFDDCWSLGVGSYTSFEDPKGQFKYNSRTRAALEYDFFRSDDPRGNRLGIFYHLGEAVERYNIRNEIGERYARYAVHGINAVGSIRKDKISLGLQLETDIQLWHPNRRRSLTAQPFVQVQIGDHVDLNFSFSITQRELPGPDPTAVDPSDFAQLSRLSYAEPLSLNGNFGISIHWDPTNGVRNDRIESI